MKTARILTATIIIGATAALNAVLAADTATLQSESSQAAATAGPKRSTQVETRLVTQFSGFAGSEDNAQSLVTGLRTGTAVTLSEAPPPGTGPAPTPLTFDVPTKPMGYGNVSISLALARQQLANLGVTDPTPEELRAALVGGTITIGSGATAKTVDLPGILTLRSQGMGWGNIAKTQGMNLGQVMSALKSGGRSTAASAAVTVNAASGAAKEMRHGTEVPAATSDAGVLHGGSNSAHAHGNFGGDTGGIVSAAGTTIGSQGNHYGNSLTSGIVRGDGTAIGASNATHGSGLARGRGK